MLISRRKFLKGLGAAGGVFLAGDFVSAIANTEGDFEMLVVGDSLISGQGLLEKDKAYELTRIWLEKEYFKERRTVKLKNKSHSGSRLFLQQDEIDALRKHGKDPEKFYHQEINFSFPSIKAQIDIAAREYKSEGTDPADVDLVLTTGSLTDINSSFILNAFAKYGPLHGKIEEHCNEGMFRFLRHATGVFPNALFAVVSYFPMVSNKSKSGEVYDAVLEVYDIPGFAKPVLNNILMKQPFKILHARITKRSRIWFEESSAALNKAVKRVNQLNKKESAVFVESPIPEARSFETEDSLLWGMGKKGRSEDDMYEVRRIECSKAIAQVKDTGLTFRRRFCELSGIGHPNPDGSRLYAEAIQKRLLEAWK
ncbi:MAG: twin-arginine translocation signal domain-containing protein [Acidobacteriota bacterium]|nr:twin-arginine translocation signal domain-containing protein [Acidobacteriota bacterium]MDH3529979.1 twin-arginine translocation signal domain-containing protein [Acidobacteriota bacterium]